MTRYVFLVSSVLAFGEIVGQFAAPLAVHPSDSDLMLRAIDVDDDGDLDMLGLFAGSSFKWFENTDGLGTFAGTLDVIDLPESCSRFDIADLNTDGLPDIVVLEDGDEEVQVLWNLGSGSFAPAASLGGLGMETRAISVAEVTGDGVPDIVVTLTYFDGAGIAWFPGNGVGFDAPVYAPLQIGGMTSTYIAGADMDLVGGTDLVVHGDNMVLALRNINGDATLWDVDTISLGSEYPYERPQLFDVDMDGDLDLAEAGSVSVHWAENPVGEGGVWSNFIDHTLEPFTSAGRGVFGHSGCNGRTTLVFIPANPGLPVRWSAWLDELGDFAYRADLPDVPRGIAPVLADLNGDEKDDLVLSHPTGAAWYASLLNDPTTVITLPAFETLCQQGAPLTLPDAEPAGGQWDGQWVDDNILYRANLPGTGDYPLSHTLYEAAGCPVAALSSIDLVNGPTVIPSLPSVLCSGQAPIQMSSEPANTTWQGLANGNILDPATFAGGMVACVFTDSTGAVCATLNGPINVWTTLPAAIIESGPFCVTDGEHLIQAALQPPLGYHWEGDIVSWNSAGATFDPSQGPGVYTVILVASPTGPGQCANSDTLLITVSGDIPVIMTPTFETYCAVGSPFALTGAEPIGGTWSGPGVTNGLMLDPTSLAAGTYSISYTYQDPAGCASSGIAEIELVDSVAVSWTTDDLIFCPTDAVTMFTAAPEGGSWSPPIGADGSFDPIATAPGPYDLIYTWSGPNGCKLTNAPATLQVWTETDVVIDPVAVLCVNHEPTILQGSHAGIWSGAVNGEGSSILFDPGAIGVGFWPVTLVAAADGQCPGIETILVEVDICSGLTEGTAPEAGLMPNPFSATTTLSLPGGTTAQIEILDATGRLVLSIPGTAATLIPLDLSGQANGTYTVRVTTNGRMSHLRAVKAD